MQRTIKSQREPAIYAVVIVSAPRDGSADRTVLASLRRGSEKIWSVVESVPGDRPTQAAMVGIFRVLGEAVHRKLTKLDVFVSEPEVIPILERKAPAPGDLGLWYLRIRSRCNQLGRVRFLAVGRRDSVPTRPRRRVGAPEDEPTLFGSAVA